MIPLAADTTPPSTSGVAVVLAVAIALIVALVLAEVLAAVTRAAGRRTWLAENLARRARRPLRTVLVIVLVWIALLIVTPSAPQPDWMTWVQHGLQIAAILAGAWLVGALMFVAEDAALARYRTGGDDRHVRRVRTQISVARRLTVLVLVVAAVSAALLTFREARTVGAGLLASAGLVSVVAGLAAQTSLSNVFAGIQLAFTDAIRLDDVVVVDGVWGRIEEITMTYVVVHVWDDRRLILPSTYFATTPFENWTRRAADLLGTVELDVDWNVPVGRMRAELMRLLQASELWDHRVGVLQVTDAVEGRVRVRALASATDAPTLWDLRCAVREGLVAWLQREHPEGLPRTRWESASAPQEQVVATVEPASEPLRTRPAGQETVLVDGGRDSGLFTGSLSAVARSKAFSGPGDRVIAEREHHAEGLRPPHSAEEGRPDR
ncbi:mechanosensitive ion channel [Isoptericola sp. b441]|uniref:Mechanosensitive ion channel n=1 Tax=Actinotalea lenta TaxID=3064654 RepID=A0ABT9D567_9CELL|nr:MULTISPECIES: mechanosensitive ion channel domain-containing protein [unclassified Isoptericola]MDO8105873.1 mechanosensitive ion channel [Isoptericola sp. b441]MDO8122589.1 mechanosensitive ion channel [Isoptericola sp. b490]